MTEPLHRPDGSADDGSGWTPPWLRFFPFLGRPPALRRRQWRVIGLIAIVDLFDPYDLSLFGPALQQIQPHPRLPRSARGRRTTVDPAAARRERARRARRLPLSDRRD